MAGADFMVLTPLTQEGLSPGAGEAVVLAGLGFRGKPVFSSYDRPRELPVAPHPGTLWSCPFIVDGVQLLVSKTCKLVPSETFGGNENNLNKYQATKKK